MGFFYSPHTRIIQQTHGTQSMGFFYFPSHTLFNNPLKPTHCAGWVSFFPHTHALSSRPMERSPWAFFIPPHQSLTLLSPPTALGGSLSFPPKHSLSSRPMERSPWAFFIPSNQPMPIKKTSLEG
ncbi:MAG: hypothetical protein EBT92_18220 [Planctomycetes bacterium]|nr:hypothetical protein [Planctomycetota bacterium]